MLELSLKRFIMYPFFIIRSIMDIYIYVDVFANGINNLYFIVYIHFCDCIREIKVCRNHSFLIDVCK